MDKKHMTNLFELQEIIKTLPPGEPLPTGPADFRADALMTLKHRISAAQHLRKIVEMCKQ